MDSFGPQRSGVGVRLSFFLTAKEREKKKQHCEPTVHPFTELNRLTFLKYVTNYAWRQKGTVSKKYVAGQEVQTVVGPSTRFVFDTSSDV